MPTTHVVIGARSGQGTTTTALALAGLAARLGPTELIAHDPSAVVALAAVGGNVDDLPISLAPNLALQSHASAEVTTVVRDAGPASGVDLGPDDGDQWRWLVLRGPCYLSLRTALDHPRHPHGIILLSEPRRALSARDVSDVLDTPVVADVPQDAGVARALDAGTLIATINRHAALAPLARLVDPGLDAAYRYAARR